MSLVRVPGLGLFKGAAGPAADVAIGAGAGLAGLAGLKYLINNVPSVKAAVPPMLIRFLPVLSGAIVAGGLYFGGKKSQAAKGRALGAFLAGAAVNVWDELRANFSQLADLVSVRMDGYRGVIINDQGGRLNGMGMLINDSSENLNQLSAINMTPDEEY